jgi:GTP-binding protein EngB required for normal cell division
MLNTLLGQKLAETGVGETTTKITPYVGESFTLWDIPGRNDELSYFSMEYISFFKGLSRRIILIQATIKENSSMMKLLDEIGLRYTIVLNKFDKVEQEEQDDVRKQIRSEVEKIGLKGVENLFFVSAKHPNMFPDWIGMNTFLTNV